jgi:energy-converting hydrogenase A subunit M
MNMGTKQDLMERWQHVEAVMTDLEKLISMRTLQLMDVQDRLVKRVQRQDITYFNIVSRKKHVSYMYLLHSTLQLESKMLRRTLFYLRHRHCTITEVRENLKQLMETPHEGEVNPAESPSELPGL